MATRKTTKRGQKPTTNIHLTPSWRDVMTARQIDVMFNGTSDVPLSIPFIRFNGPGMYLTQKDSVLVVPQKYQPRPWKRKQHPSVKYDVYVWNNVDISNTINLLSNAPVRADER